MPVPFLKLEDLLLAPPLAAALGALMAIGLAAMGVVLARWLRGPAFEPLDGAAGIALILGLTGGAIHALALAQALSRWPLRLAAWGLAAVGILACVVAREKIVALSREARVRWLALSGLERTLAALLAATALFLALAALGPASDIDSLNYHLGVPLDWLRQGGAYPRTDWYAARFVGLGESLNLLGLAGGTDCLGACLQAIGGALAAVAATTFCRSDRDRLVLAGLVVSTPILLSLVPVQKFQLLPAAATAVALAMSVKRREALDRSTVLLGCAAAAFAAGCKYSFLLSAAVVLAMILGNAARCRRLAFGLLCVGGAIALLAAPIYARNLVFYGDPLSPFLERWRLHPDPSLVAYADFQRFYSAGLGPGRQTLALLALHLVASQNLRTVLGVGILCLPLVPLREPSARQLLLAAGVAAALSAGLSRLDPRFLLEPYLWGLVALGAGVPRSRWLTVAVSGQAALVAAFAATAGAAIVFPGAFNRGRRAEAAIISAWMDREMAPNDAVLTAITWRAMFPRPFGVGDWLDGSLPIETERARLREAIRSQRLTVLAVVDDEQLPPSLAEIARDAVPIGPPLELAAERPRFRFWASSSTSTRLRLLRLRRPPQESDRRRLEP